MVYTLTKDSKRVYTWFMFKHRWFILGIYILYTVHLISMFPVNFQPCSVGHGLSRGQRDISMVALFKRIDLIMTFWTE